MQNTLLLFPIDNASRRLVDSRWDERRRSFGPKQPFRDPASQQRPRLSGWWLAEVEGESESF